MLILSIKFHVTLCEFFQKHFKSFCDLEDRDQITKISLSLWLMITIYINARLYDKIPPTGSEIYSRYTLLRVPMINHVNEVKVIKVYHLWLVSMTYLCISLFKGYPTYKTMILIMGSRSQIYIKLEIVPKVCLSGLAGIKPMAQELFLVKISYMQVLL